MSYQTGEFCWSELATTDVGKAKDFYGKVFGWQFKEIKTDDMTYTMIKSQKGTQEFAGIWQIPSDQQEHIPPHWMAYILVENVQDTLAESMKHGAKEMKGVTHVGDMGKFAIICDPTGAHIALWETVNK